MPVELDELVDIANQSEISSISSVVCSIIDVVQNPNSDADDLKHLVEVDPPLCSRILKRANSAYYGGSGKNLTEIRDAIITLGFDEVKNLALSQKVYEWFGNGAKSCGYSRKALWVHSVGVALAGRLLYQKQFREKGDHVYTAGLLHDIGVIVEDQFLKKEFLRIVEKVDTGANMLEAEIEVLGYSHEDVGSRLVANWGLPSDLCMAISCAERPERAPEEYGKISRTLYVANRLTRIQNIGYNEMPNDDAAAFESCLADLKLDSDDIASVMEEVVENIEKMEKDNWF